MGSKFGEGYKFFRKKKYLKKSNKKYPFFFSSHDEIAAVISKVPLEENYLKNVVKQIHQDLLKD